MSPEEKRKLGAGLARLSPEELNKALEIIAQKNRSFQATAEEVELDMDAQSESTLWRLKFFVKEALEVKSKSSVSNGGNENSKRKREICDAIAKTAKKRRLLSTAESCSVFRGFGVDSGDWMRGEMDLVSSCKDKLAYFRIKELKDVLTQLSLAKQGKKQDLVDRILVVLSDEQGCPHVKHAMCYGNFVQFLRCMVGQKKILLGRARKMKVHDATDLASRGTSCSDVNIVKLKEEVDDSFQVEMKVRCCCGSSLRTEPMSQRLVYFGSSYTCQSYGCCGTLQVCRHAARQYV
ncbi:hypothetical protein HHK36_019162 [Tetracentron sinense]|uniref:SAP domain-containing protein n=1 Tax=Tetracentron sinense TaxID=13715 RepID=A0A834YX50_TETSI|nr:hypothetical protein HHK36_019162 [Tetracentron sinense]